MTSALLGRRGDEGVEVFDTRISLRLAATPSAVMLDFGHAYSQTEDRQCRKLNMQEWSWLHSLVMVTPHST